jgi:multiple sugar transport system permease protein
MSLQSSHHWVRRLNKGLIYVGLIVWSLVCLFPIYWVTVTSFKDVYLIDKAPTYIPILDFTPSLDAWRFILLDANENLTSRAANSVIIVFFSTLLTMVIGGMAVYGLTRFVPKVSAAGVMTFMLCSRILPPVTIVLPLYFMAQFTGTRDSLGFLIFVYTAINLPIAVWMLAPVFGPKATEQEEAAQIDGASHMYIFFQVLLPMVRTAMITVGLLVFLQCWNEYLFAVYLTSDHALTVPPWMVGQLSMKEAQIGGEAEEWAHLSAATVVMVLPALIFAVFSQRFLGHAFVVRPAAK